MIEHSCGTVLFTVIGGIRHYLLIETERGEVGLPKGHIEVGETEEACALRETWEETSIRGAHIPGFRHEITYSLGSGRKKRVTFFLASFRDEEPCHNEGFERHRYHLLSYAKALTALTYENTKPVLQRAEMFLREN